MADAEARFGKELLESLLQLKPREVLPRIVVLPNRLLLLQMVEHTNESVVPFERVRESIRARLTAERAADAWTSFVAKTEQERGLVLLE